MVLVAIFFVSGADAASIVMGSLSERGTIEPSRATVVFWGAATGAVAAVMLLVGGDDALTGLQIVHDPGGAAVRPRDGRPGGRPGEGPAHRPDDGPQRYAAEAVDDAVIAGVSTTATTSAWWSPEKPLRRTSPGNRLSIQLDSREKQERPDESFAAKRFIGEVRDDDHENDRGQVGDRR